MVSSPTVEAGTPDGAVPQIDENTLSGRLEPAQRGMDRLGAAENVFEDIGAVQPGREIAAVADIAIDEGIMVDLVERRHDRHSR